MYEPGTPRAGERPPRFWLLFDRLDWWLLWVERVGMGVAAAFAGVIFLLLIAGVFARPWSGFVFSFALEWGAMAMWPVSFMGLAYVWRTHGHVQWDLLLRKTRFRRHHVLQLLNSIAGLVVGVLFAWLGWLGFLFQYRSGAATQTFIYPHWPLFSTVFIGSVILALELVSSVLREVREVMHPTGSEEAVYGVYDEADLGL